MSVRFPFSTAKIVKYNSRGQRFTNVESSSVMSQVHADQVRTWLYLRASEIAVRHPSVAGPIRAHVAAHVALVQPLFVAAIGAAPPVVIPAAHANPVAGPGLPAVAAAAIDAHFQALVAPALAVAPQEEPSYDIEGLLILPPTEAEYQELEWQITKAMTHSGFTRLGQYNQMVQFTCQNVPAYPEYNVFEVDDFVDNLPNGVSPFNYGAYHASTIAVNGKAENLTWRWGERHGCPDAVPYLGFPTWEYIDHSLKLISSDIRLQLLAMSQKALRDKQVVMFQDPTRGVDQGHEDVLAAADNVSFVDAANRRKAHQIKERRGHRYSGDFREERTEGSTRGGTGY